MTSWLRGRLGFSRYPVKLWGPRGGFWERRKVVNDDDVAGKAMEVERCGGCGERKEKSIGFGRRKRAFPQTPF